MLLEITSTIAGKVAFVTHATGSEASRYTSQCTLRIQSFKIGPLEDFEKIGY